MELRNRFHLVALMSVEHARAPNVNPEQAKVNVALAEELVSNRSVKDLL